MTIQEAIKKYNLKKVNKDCFGGKIYYNCYQNEIEIDNIKTIYTLDNQMSVDLDDGSIYFLHIEKFDYNKIIYNKKLDTYRPTITNKTVEIRA